MKRFLIRSVFALGLFAGGIIGSSRLTAEESPKQELPTAETILNKEVEAVGGMEVNQKVKTVFMKAKVAVNDMAIQFVMYHAGSDKHYKEFSLEGVGAKEVVVCRDLAWSKDSITGARLLGGAEKTKAFHEADDFTDVFRRVGQWRTRFKEAKCVAEEKVEGKAAYRLVLTSTKGQVFIDHYDKETGLLVRREVDEGRQGQANSYTLFSDFRKVDGIVHAFTTRIVNGANEVKVTIERIEHNVIVPEDRFAPPPELKKLIANQK